MYLIKLSWICFSVSQSRSGVVVDRILEIRKEKEYLPRPYEGECKHISNLGQVDLSKGKWLILTRTKNQLLDLMKQVRKKNLYYQSNKGRSYKVRLYKAAKLYTEWTKGKSLIVTNMIEKKLDG